MSIFEKTGLSHSDAQWANLGAGCINLFIAGFSPLLMTKLNRRPLILWSSFISGVFLTILTFIVHYIVSNQRSKNELDPTDGLMYLCLQDKAAWLPFACIVAVFGYIIAYQFGLGPIPYFIGSGKLLKISSNVPSTLKHVSCSHSQSSSRAHRVRPPWRLAVCPRGPATSSSAWHFRLCRRSGERSFFYRLLLPVFC